MQTLRKSLQGSGRKEAGLEEWALAVGGRGIRSETSVLAFVGFYYERTL